MLRVGYPDKLPAELLTLFPEEVEMIPIPNAPPANITIDVWIAPPSPVLGASIWPRLVGVSTVLSMMAGTEWLIDLVGPEVTVCNAQGAHSISTAEWTVAAIFSMLKYFPLYRDLQQKQDWAGRSQASKEYREIHQDFGVQFPPILQEELSGKKVLIVGYGDIGRTIETFLAPFDVIVTRVARSARKSPPVHAVDSLDSLLPAQDVIVLILPLTPGSHHLIGTPQIEKMSQGALLVNAARGPIVDTDALVQALNAGRIRAAIDVTDPEPLPPDHPLWQCKNLLITPHVAGSTPNFSPRATRIAAEQVSRLVNGQPLLHVVQEGRNLR